MNNFQSISKDEFELIMEKAIIENGGHTLQSIHSFAHESNAPATRFTINNISSSLWMFSLMRIIHAEAGDIYQHIPSHTSRFC